MSDTPRTDKASRESTAFDTPTNAINFARQLELENAELRKDKERLDKLQSSHLALYCSDEGEVWRKKGIYTIREYIDKKMEEPQ